MTKEDAIKYYQEEILSLKLAPKLNGCEMREDWKLLIEAHTMAVDALKEETCDGCKWLNSRHQKCSCCRRNKGLKDCYEVEK